MSSFGALTPTSSVFEGGITAVRHYSAKLWELLKFDFRLLYPIQKNTRIIRISGPNQDSLFTFLHLQVRSVRTVREYYGRLALSDIVIRIPKIQFLILTPHSKTHTGLTFDDLARSSLVAREKETPEVELD
ncbi:hypothetical protein TNCV_3368081 [Trichonephila clavipes]|nr:hypothetical protein TNCV_3368081 [Trichonephila clavipes]